MCHFRVFLNFENAPKISSFVFQTWLELVRIEKLSNEWWEVFDYVFQMEPTFPEGDGGLAHKVPENLGN